jgi:hypothetical protein
MKNHEILDWCCDGNNMTFEETQVAEFICICGQSVDKRNGICADCWGDIQREDR